MLTVAFSCWVSSCWMSLGWVSWRQWTDISKNFPFPSPSLQQVLLLSLSLTHTHTHTHTPHTLSLSLSPHTLSRHCFYDWKLVCIEMFSWTLCFKFSSLTRSLSLSLFLFPFLATWFSFYLYSLPHFKKLRRTIFFWKEIDFKFGLN